MNNEVTVRVYHYKPKGAAGGTALIFGLMGFAIYKLAEKNSKLNREIDILKKGNYGFNLKGSKALNLMMDNETPKIDLLVRESIQNSADATLNDKKGCIIQFDLVSFDSKNLAAILDVAGTVFGNFRFGDCDKRAIDFVLVVFNAGKPFYARPAEQVK